MPEYKRCFIILIDGARPDVMNELIQRGDMPNLAQHFVEPYGFHTAVSCFPSTTGPAYMPFLTGCFPGTANIPGIRWLDKSAVNGRPSKAARSYMGYEALNLNPDISSENVTLFEIFPRSQNIYNMVTRGLSKVGDLTKRVKPWLYAFAHFTEKWRPVDAAAQKHLLAGLDHNPDFVFAVFPGVDSFTHLAHPRHSEVLRAYRVADESLGLLIEALRQRGWLEETLLFVVSDHGLTETHTHFDTVGFLDQRGFKAMHYPLIFRTNPRAAVMVSGNAMTHVYFKNGKGWLPYLQAESLDPGLRRLLEEFLEDPAIDIVLMRSQRGVMAFSRRGQAEIQSENGTIKYAPVTGDPFGYGNLPAQFSISESLALTTGSEYPDALLQALQVFRSPRSGDMILSATAGYDLRLAYEWPEHKSSHGSLHREHVLVPVLANHPLPERSFRTVDVYPTILSLMAKDFTTRIDGVSLVELGATLE